MKRIHLFLLAVGLVAASGVLLPWVVAEDADPANPLDHFTREWRDDPVWFDGKAEIAEYEATRTIYGSERRYTAKLMTNKEHADPESKTKSADGSGRSVFKFHAREDIPTQKYTYHYSTMVYVGTDDLKCLKLDMGSMEDCGASFKQLVNHQGELTWHQFSYFPNEGHRTGAYEPAANLVFHDALPLVLRGYPFDNPEPMNLALLPEQTTTKWSAYEPTQTAVEHLGVSELELPFGKIAAHHLTVGPDQFWFAADPDLRHVMVAYESPDGITYRLKSLRREAYWVN